MEGPPVLQVGSRKECFTPMQSRRFLAPSLVACRLCPSMDLMVMGLAAPNKQEASTSQLRLLRTLSGQKLATLQGPDDNDDDKGTMISHATWRPDGRLLACAETTGRITLHRVEALLSASVSDAAMMMNTSTSAGGSGQVVTSFSVAAAVSICGLAWAHVGKPHPLWNLSEDEREDLIAWGVQSRFVDRQGLYLPPSQYHQEHAEAGDSSGAGALPTCRTPLSLLCVATSQTSPSSIEAPLYDLQVYLHGCYPVLQNIPLESEQSRPIQKEMTLVASTDLSHLLVRSGPSTLTLLSMSALSQQRYDLQIISALYSSTTKHLHVLQKSATEIAASWKSSIKPLDMKLDALTRLLQSYGLVESEDDSTASSIRRLLVQYILSGHTRSAPNLSNAMDQFFTGVQMNDQLIQRMEASLTVAVANVEVQVRQNLLSPAQALLYQVSSSQLLNCQLVSTTDLQRWQSYCEILLQSTQMALTALIEARFRMRDYVAWLRSTSAQIKARGTAPNSARRENAKKRRVPDRVVQRMLTYLQQSKGLSNGNTTTTEDILNLQFGQFLQENREYVRQCVRRSTSPQSVREPTPSMQTIQTTTPTLPTVTAKTQQAALAVFAGPPKYLEGRVQSTRLDLSQHNNNKRSLVMAMTTRLGCGGMDERRIPFGEPKPDGFFCPAAESNHHDPSKFRQWSLLALALSSTGNEEDTAAIRLHALPLHWTPRAGLGDSFAWTVDLILPPFYQVVDLAFYQDDGKSSLSSGQDSGTGKEGNRQALAVLARRRSNPSPVAELWIVPYQQLQYDVLPLAASSERNDRYSLPLQTPNCSYKVVFVQEDKDPVPEGFEVYARTRTVGSLEEAQLVLSGPRGMAAVSGRQNGGTVLELLDLEEDEEDGEEMEDEQD